MDRPDLFNVSGKDQLRRLLRALPPYNKPHQLFFDRTRQFLVERNFLPPAVIAAYSPLSHEVNLTPFLEGLEGYRLALPVVIASSEPLIFREWRVLDPLETGFFGICQPLAASPEVTPSILFVPMLAFDDRGYRLGLGEGFYDRTLEALRRKGPLCAIGFAFDEQRVSSIPIEEHDQKLDYILTQSTCYGPFL